MINHRRTSHVSLLQTSVGLVCALAMSLAAEGRRSDPARSGRVVFEDDFSQQDIDRGRWPTVNDATLSPSGEAGLSMREGPLRRAALRSRGIVLDDVGAAVLFFQVVFEDRDEPSLVVEYRSHDRQWRLLSSVESRGAGGLVQSETAALPTDALHDRFSMRFRVESESPTTSLRLLNVRLETFADRGILAVSVASGAAGSVSVSRADMAPSVEATPLVWAMPLGDWVSVVAPPRIDRDVFGYWIVNDQFVGDRSFSESLEDHVLAEAYYEPVDKAARTAFVYVEGVFSGQLAIGLRLETAPATWTIVTPMAQEVLVGEKLRASAPARVADQVFWRWIMDGALVETREPDLSFEASGDVQLIAEYLFVGDMNADGLIDEFDVDAFAMALADPGGYAELFPDVDPFSVGDLNADGRLDEADVDPFVRLFFDR